MSGGSMDYLSYKVEGATFRERTVLRRAFKAHLNKVAAALHAIEWNDSGDGADGEDELIRACLSESAAIEEAIRTAKEAHSQLGAEIEAAASGRR